MRLRWQMRTGVVAVPFVGPGMRVVVGGRVERLQCYDLLCCSLECFWPYVK